MEEQKQADSGKNDNQSTTNILGIGQQMKIENTNQSEAQSAYDLIGKRRPFPGQDTATILQDRSIQSRRTRGRGSFFQNSPSTRINLNHN